MKCPNCNIELKDGELICHKCGALIEESENMTQPKTEDIMNYEVFEETEAEEEREESLKIVDGFYKESRKREEIQKVLDQACDELRKNGVILVASKADAEAYEGETDLAEVEVTAPAAKEIVEETEDAIEELEEVIEEPEEIIEEAEEIIQESEEIIEEAEEFTEEAEEVIADVEAEESKHENAIDAEVAAIMAEIEGALDSGTQTGGYAEENLGAVQDKYEADVRTWETEADADTDTDTTDSYVDEEDEVAGNESDAELDEVEQIEHSEQQEQAEENERVEKADLMEEEAQEESIDSRATGADSKKVNYFHIALAVLVTISIIFLLLITVGEDTTIGKKVIQLFYSSSLNDTSTYLLAMRSMPIVY